MWDPLGVVNTYMYTYIYILYHKSAHPHISTRFYTCGETVSQPAATSGAAQRVTDPADSISRRACSCFFWGGGSFNCVWIRGRVNAASTLKWTASYLIIYV